MLLQLKSFHKVIFKSVHRAWHFKTDVFHHLRWSRCEQVFTSVLLLAPSIMIGFNGDNILKVCPSQPYWLPYTMLPKRHTCTRNIFNNFTLIQCSVTSITSHFNGPLLAILQHLAKAFVWYFFSNIYWEKYPVINSYAVTKVTWHIKDKDKEK